MCVYGRAESLFGALHEIAASSAVHMDVNSPRHYVAAFCVEKARTLDVQLVVRHFDYLVAVYDYRPAPNPALRGENPSV